MSHFIRCAYDYNMNYLVCIILAILPLVAAEYQSGQTCPYMFKCVDNSRFKICLNNQPVSWEFSCPESTYCSENSSEICTQLPISSTDQNIENITEELASTTDSNTLCQDEGKYAILNTDCTTYILCSLTIDGFQSKEYTCPIGFLFDPNLKRCTKAYKCPELEISSETNSQETFTEQSELTVDDATLIPDSTTLTSSLPVCKEEGKLPVPNTQCNIFLLCVYTSTGFREKQYSCPSGYQFDPYKKKCTNKYTCPELTTVSTPAVTPPVTDSTEIVSHENIISTTFETSTSNSEISMCEELGNIPIPDTGCTKYLSCSLTNHELVATELTCSPGYLFDPDIQNCTNTYECDDLLMSTIAMTEEIEVATTSSDNLTTVDTETSSTEKPDVCKEEGKYPIPDSNCTKYMLCVLTSTGIRNMIYTCPAEFNFNPETRKCSKLYVCPELSTTSNIDTSTHSTNTVTNEVTVTDIINTTYPVGEILTNLSTTNSPSTTCATPGDIIEPECIQQGRFPIFGSNCQQYVLCMQTKNGFKSKSYQCPENTAFNPDTRRCVQQYECTELLTSCGTTHKTPTAAPSTTTSTPWAEVQFPECKDQGKLPINNTDCKNYLFCMWSSSGFISAMYSCPNETFFDPKLGNCSSSYECLDTEIRNKRNIAPTCATVGQFADPTDPSCLYYYSCTESANGTVKGVREQCKGGQFFDSEIQKCSAGYYCTKNRLRKLTKQTVNNVISSRMLVNGVCTTVGRYLVPGSNCKNYVLCRAGTNGVLTQTNFFCPTTTVFNQIIQQCTSSYTCPDSVCFTPGWIPNPNVKDCSSYIECTPNFNVAGMVTSFTGTLQYCPPGSYYHPYMMFCDSTYVCPT